MQCTAVAPPWFYMYKYIYIYLDEPMKSKRICELCISSEKAAVFPAEMLIFSWLFFVTSSVLLIEIKKTKFDERSVLCVSGWRALQNYIQWHLSFAHQLWKSHIKSFTNTLSLNLETPSENTHPTSFEEGQHRRVESLVSVPFQVCIITSLFSNEWPWWNQWMTQT